jgi:hypothetical protein
VGLAEGATLFGKEALSFQVLFARLKIIKSGNNPTKYYESSYCAVEALAVEVVAKCLDPAVTSFNWETASKTLGGEQLIPI